MSRPLPFLASLALVCAVAEGQVPRAFGPARPARPAVELRYSFRAGDSWHERIVHELESSDPSGVGATNLASERVELVEVLYVRADGGARLRRRELSGGDGGTPEEVRRRTLAAVEIELSPRGEVLDVRAGGRAAEGPASQALKGLVARYWPVLPGAPLAEGESSSRRIASALPGAAVFEETETTTLAAVEHGPLGHQTAVLRLVRRAEPSAGGAGEFFLDALLAPDRGALRALPGRGLVRGELCGASGEGELRFEVAAGRLVSYRMEETLGLAAGLLAAWPRQGPGSPGQARASAVRTVRAKALIERLAPR